MLMPWKKNKIEKDFWKIRLLPTEMREKGEYLLMNSKIGRKCLGKANGRKIYSNCLGI